MPGILKLQTNSFGQEVPIGVGSVSPFLQGLSPLFLIHITVGHQERDYNFVSAWLACLDIIVTVGLLGVVF